MDGFRFGLEAEFLLVRKDDLKPLWHKDVTFAHLNRILESISLKGIGSMDGLELEHPHRKNMPFVVEGYHVPDQDFSAIDILPKGVEIRTPVCGTLDECLRSFDLLFDRLQVALNNEGMLAIALSHHPLEKTFSGPQNKRRHDYWQWAMEVMTTYGPDINVSIPRELRSSFNLQDLESKIDHYGPALAALSVASPFVDGGLWRYRGDVGKSYRMHKRSAIAPPIEAHPDEDGRLEFKVFDMPNSTLDFRCQFLCFLSLLLTPNLGARGTRQSRIYDLGQVARFGLEAEGVHESLTELFEKAPETLRRWGFDPTPLEHFRRRLDSSRTPADDLIASYRRAGNCLETVLAERALFSSESLQMKLGAI